MENYNIYDEVGRGTHSFVYKARRKRSIEYVAVKSTAKCRMVKILNEVQFLHKLDSPYVLKFYNWYESQNHIWLIFEYCIGGDLLNLITQDKRLPERAVQTFGRELVAGLQYLHYNGVLFCDLKPANILVDEFGSLKLADFGLARRIPTSNSPLDQSLAPGSPNYMAPELFQQPAIHSFASDFWALGCVLFEMATGKQAFTHTVFSELARKIQTKTPELPDGDICALSNSFRNLLERLLHKNPYQRMSWDELLQHPFWSGCPALDIVNMPEQELFDAGSPNNHREPEVEGPQFCAARTSRDSQSRSSDAEQDMPENAPTADDRDRSPSNNHSNSSPSASREFLSPDEGEYKNENAAELRDRPVSAPALSTKPSSQKRDSKLANSSMPSQNRGPESTRAESNLATPTNPRLHIEDTNKVDASGIVKLPSTAPAATIGRRSPSRTTLLETAFVQDGKSGSGLRKVSTLMFYPGDCRSKPIAWSDEIEHVSLPLSRPDLLPFAAVTADQLLSSDTEKLERYLMEIYITLKRTDMETEEAAALMAHLFAYCCHPKLANVIINSSILALLTKMIALDSSTSPRRSPVLVSMACLTVGVLFRFAAFFAPTSSDQLQSLLQGLAAISNQAASSSPVMQGRLSLSGLDPRRLATACLGEILVCTSTQKEWQAAASAWDQLLSALRDKDLIVRHYAAQTLCNIILNCRDESLLLKLTSEQVVAVLARSIVEYSDIVGGGPDKADFLDVWGTTTQAMAQALRFLRSPATKGRHVSAQRCSVLLVLAKRNVIRALWHGFQSGEAGERLDLAVASLNVLNVFLEQKLNGCRDTDLETIEMAREDLLERVVTFPEVTAIMEAKASFSGRRHSHSTRGHSSDMTLRSDEPGDEDVAILQAKVAILLYLGIQSSKAFVDRCLQAQMLRLIEQVFAPLATIVRNAQQQSDTADAGTSITGPRSNGRQPIDSLSSSNTHLLQCLMNLVKMSLHRALKLGAECISANARTSESGTGRVAIEATPFKLFESLLRSPACRLQLVHYFLANTNKHYTFFLRLVTKMLADFPSETLDGDADRTTVGVSLGHILLRLFQCATTDARDIVTVEPEILYLNLLPALADRMSSDLGITVTDNSAELSVTSIRIIYLVLLQFDGNETDTQVSKYRDTFMRSCLLPRLCSLLMSGHELNENVWRFAVELLFGLLSKHESLLVGAEANLLAAAIVQLLDTPRRRNYHSLPSSATKMVKMLVMKGKQGDQQLYDVGIAKSLLGALRFATGAALGGCLMDLLEILLQLLHSRYEEARKAGSSALAPPAPRQFDSLRDSGPLITQLCAIHHDRTSPSKSGSTDDSTVDSEPPRNGHEAAVADLASRCLIFLSQLFGEKLNDVLFAAEGSRGSSKDSAVSRSIQVCLDRPDATSSAVVLRVLLTLKNCLRCQSNNNNVVSGWLTANPKLGRLLKRFSCAVSTQQHLTTKRSGATTSEQIIKTAADILRLCDAISPPRQS